MPRLFYGNFDFEHELVHGKRWQPNKSVRQRTAQLTNVWRDIANEGDLIWTPDTTIEQLLSGKDPADYEFVPWGWSAVTIDLAERYFPQQPHPPLEVVKRANSKVSAMEQPVEHRLPEFHIIRDTAEIAPALSCFKNRSWVIKAEFGMSGRERITGRGSTLSEQQVGWCRNRLDHQSLVLQPLLARRWEASLHYSIHEHGHFKLEGTTGIESGLRGEYLGNTVFPGIDHERAIRDVEPILRDHVAIIQNLTQCGYFGSVSFDVLVHARHDEERYWSNMDINARWTMGRIASQWGARQNFKQPQLWRPPYMSSDSNQ